MFSVFGSLASCFTVSADGSMGKEDRVNLYFLETVLWNAGDCWIIILEIVAKFSQFKQVRDIHNTFYMDLYSRQHYQNLSKWN